MAFRRRRSALGSYLVSAECAPTTVDERRNDKQSRRKFGGGGKLYADLFSHLPLIAFSTEQLESLLESSPSASRQRGATASSRLVCCN
eukprot:COSAG06_NODE_33166_length_494_cov_0.779747_1_plen_87_part_10